MATLAQARAAQKVMLERLASVDRYAAVGITVEGRGYGLRVNLRDPSAQVPVKLDGVPVSVVVVGQVRAL